MGWQSEFDDGRSRLRRDLKVRSAFLSSYREFFLSLYIE